MALAATRFPRFQFQSPGPTLNPKSPSPTVKAVMDLRDAPKFRAVAAAASGSVAAGEFHRKLPILLFDIMSTVVGMTHKELMECKHPAAWNEFEKALIDEVELSRIFFKDGRSFDLEGLKNCMRAGYEYLHGDEKLLQDLKKNGYEMHAFTNYPIRYALCCVAGKRKPDLEFYRDALRYLNVDADNCIFIDDRCRDGKMKFSGPLLKVLSITYNM